MAELPDVKAVLNTIYTPKLTLNKFVVKSLEKYPKLQLKDIQAFWKEANFKEKKETSKEAPEKTVKQRIQGLDKEQITALQDLFYRDHKGAVGVRALWELLKQHPKQIAELERTNNKFGWISWRELRAWYGAQESVQRHRRANKKSKTLVKLPDEETLRPFARMQLDTIEMGREKRAGGDAPYRLGDNVQVDDEIDRRGLPDGNMNKIFHLVDMATNYSFLAASERLNQDSAIRAVTEFIDAVREHYGRWPTSTVITTDVGKEYQTRFRQAIEAYEPKIKIKVNQAYSVNDNAVVEGANGVFRRLAKRHAESNRQNRPARTRKNYLSYWYGSGGEILRELNALMNTRPVSSLGYQTPADVLEAWMDPRSAEDAEIIKKAKKSKFGTARKRRAPSHVQKFEIGDKVRKINLKYLKDAGKRGNIMKQRPPWSKTIYEVTDRRGGDDNMPEYQLDNEDKWILHNLLQKVPGGLAIPPPAAVVRDYPYDGDFEEFKRIPALNRVYYRGYPLPERITGQIPPPGAVLPPAPPPPPPDTDTESDSDDEADPPPLPARRTRRPPQRFNPSGNGLKLKKFP